MKKILLFGFVFLLLISSVSADLNTSLVSYYKFDGNATDELGNYDGTVNGATYGAGFGKINGAYDYDGNDYIELFDFTNGIGDNNPFTVSLWVNPDVDNAYQAIFEHYDGAEQFRIALGASATLAFATYGSGWNGFATSTVPYSDNVWQHLVFQFNGTYYKIYVNGTLADETADSDSTLPTGVVDLGRRKDAGNSYVDGTIDEVAIWNRVLSQTEIESLFANGDGFQYPFTAVPPSSVTAFEVLNGTEYNLSTTNYTIDNSFITNNVTLNSTCVTFHTNTTFEIQYCNVSESNVFLNISNPLSSTAVISSTTNTTADITQYKCNFTTFNETEAYINYQIYKNDVLLSEDFSNSTNYSSGSIHNVLNSTADTFQIGDVIDFNCRIVLDEFISYPSEWSNSSMTILDPFFINSTYLNSSTNDTSTDLEGHARVTHATGDTITAYYNLYRNGVLNGTGNYTTLASNTDTIISNFTLDAGGTYIMESWFTDGWITTNKVNTSEYELQFTITINLFNEETKDFLPENVSITFNYLGEYTNFSTNVTVTNYTTSLNVPEDFIRIQYVPDGYEINNYYYNFLNGTISNFSLYSLLSNTTFSELRLNVVDGATFEDLSEVIVKMERLYPQENVFATVQMQESGEDGLTLFDIQEEDVDYRFIFMEKDDTILKTSEKLKFSCDLSVCTLTFLVADEVSGVVVPEITISESLQGETENNSILWEDAKGDSHTVEIKVLKTTYTGDLTICSSTTSGALGNFTCNLSGVTGDLFVNTVVDGDQNSGFWVRISTPTFPSLLGEDEGAFWTLGIVLTVIMMGLFSALGAIIFTIVGLIIAFFFSFATPLTLGVIIISAVIGIAIGLKVRQ